ncbi:MAG: putative terminase large subunit [Prokaryotic dsDNA virus sp.]|nr:MAG: putative terminase large subunit [Prokaryotic dsDNA virus sp.]
MRIRPTITAKQDIAFLYLKDKETNEILFGGGAGGGKSWFICAALITHCIKYKGIRVLLGRSKLTALKTTTLNTFFDVCKQWNLETPKHYNYNAQTNIITFFNGSEVILKDLFQYPSDRNFDSLGSLELTMAAIDECNQITEKAKNIVASRLRYKLDEYNLIPKLILTCNPSKNWVYTEFYRKYQENKLPKHRKFIQALVDDNANISIHYKEQLNRLDELSKQRLLFGNWEYDLSKDSLIDYNAIIGLFENKGIQGEKYISCDVARFGGDRTVIMLWQGLHIKYVRSILKSAVNEVVDEIKKLQQDNQVPLRNIIVDSDGVGGGVKDYLRCQSFQANARPLKNENYQNLKTQCYYKLAEVINTGQLGITCSDVNVKSYIIEELEQVRMQNQDKDHTKLQIIPKDTVKDIIGRSPDYSDAMAIRMYYQIDSNYGKYYVS